MEVKNLIKSLKDKPQDLEENMKELSQCVDEVAVDKEDVDILESLALQQASVEILKLIADLARNESNRQVLSREKLMKHVLSYVNSDKAELTLQAIRCICNISAENDPVKEIFLAADGVKIILSKAEAILTCSDKEWEELVAPACSCIQNMVMDNETLQKRFLDENALKLLWKYLEKFHSTNMQLSSVVINGITHLAENDFGLQKVYDDGVLQSVLDLLKKCNDEIGLLLFTVLLKEYSNAENGRLLLIKSRYVSLLTEIIESRDSFTQETADPLTKEMADLVVVLTSGEDSFNELRKMDQDFLRRFSQWVMSPNKHIQVSAGLALGNYARDEETCGDLMRYKIYENLINTITEHQNDEDYDDRLQAFNSCLRNLCIPVENKSVLIDAGLPKLAISQVKKASLPVQFKALAILRLLVQDSHVLSTSLSLDQELIEKIVELSKTSVVSSVPSESQRLLATVVKYSSAAEPIALLLKYGALDAILPLLLSDHLIMQNEGLIALIITAANYQDCIEEYKTKECIPKVFELLRKPEIQPQTCFNGLTLLQAMLSLNGGRDLMISHNVDEILSKLKAHPDTLIQDKATETEDLINNVR